MSGINLDPNNETKPVIHDGDYEFRQGLTGYIAITNGNNETKTFSIDALKRMAKSTGMPVAVRAMAQAALDWAEQS